MSETLLQAFMIIVIINILLALFNLVPIPPLDGSKVLSGILPRPLSHVYDTFRNAFESLGILTGTLLILIVFVYVLSPVFFVAIRAVAQVLTGLPI